MIEYALNYEDVVLTPNQSILRSRTQADVSTIFGGRIFSLPIVPANMTCCINSDWAYWFSNHDFFYIMHRFNGKNNLKDLRWFVERANKENWRTISISIGIHEEDRTLLEWAINNKHRIDFLTIDIAHGHCTPMKEMLEYIHHLFQQVREISS